MKKLFSLILIPTLILLPGCGLHLTELSDRLIIEAIGIDRTENGFTVTVQALDNLAVGIDEGVPESGVTKCYTFYGTTVGEAFSRIGAQTGLSPLYSQARLLLLGYPTAEQNLCETLDFFLREQNTRADIAVAVAEHTAEEVVTASFGKNRVGASVLEDALRSGEENGAALTVPLYAFMNLLLSETDAACCPLLGVRENSLTGDSLARPLGCVVFQGTKIGTTITQNDMLPLLFLTGQTGNADFTVNCGDTRCTLRLMRGRTKIRLAEEDGRPYFKIAIDARCDITEVVSSSFAPLDTRQVRAVADAASAFLTETTASLLDRCFYREGCDVCRFYTRFHLRRPGAYRAMAAASPLSPADCPCEIRCSVTIRRTGKEILRQD